MKIFIHTNETEKSVIAEDKLRETLEKAGLELTEKFSPDCDFVFCIGGDGSFLRLLRTYELNGIPVAGINTGHLGFFQEFRPENIEDLVRTIRSGEYSIQNHRLLQAEIYMADGRCVRLKGINDVLIKGRISSIVHLDLNIGDDFIENYSGDGLLVSTPAGSTAYNYSLRGAIVDPRIEVLQITPIAPVNTSAYRCFTSSVLVPGEADVLMYPNTDFSDSVVVAVDGDEHPFENVRLIKTRFCEDMVNLVRAKGYDFWGKVKSKFLD